MVNFSKIDQVRAEESRKLARSGEGELLKKSRWAISKRPENLKESQELKHSKDAFWSEALTSAVIAETLAKEFLAKEEAVSAYLAAFFLQISARLLAQFCSQMIRIRSSNPPCRSRTLSLGRMLKLN